MLRRLLALTVLVGQVFSIPEGLRLLPGFSISVYAEIEGARSMALATDGTLFVGTRDRKKVYAWQNGTLHTLLRDRNMPNGVAYKDGDLYVAEIDRILRLKDVLKNLEKPRLEVFVKGLPLDTHHGWKFIRFGPDGQLYVPVGAPCNVCLKPDPYASILRLDLDSRKFETVARGVRNTVGFDFSPVDGSLWFSDNGRDWLGDDAPPEEINQLTSLGQHFGFPHCHGKDILDPEHGEGHSCDRFVAPAMTLQAHTAGLGMRFYTGSQFPEKFHGGIFLAQHGSWNRSSRVGYQVVFLPMRNNQVQEPEVFIGGFLKPDQSVSGRPVDVEVMPDGSLLISDDHRGRIYRVSYSKPQNL